MSNDPKLDKFEQLATRRVESALHSIRLISNLSNRSAYHYTQEHVSRIFTALKDAVAKAEESFQEKEETASSFTFAGIDTSHAEFHDDDEDEASESEGETNE